MKTNPSFQFSKDQGDSCYFNPLKANFNLFLSSLFQQNHHNIFHQLHENQNKLSSFQKQFHQLSIVNEQPESNSSISTKKQPTHKMKNSSQENKIGKQKRQGRKYKNSEAKNIAKNFGKAILRFISSNREMVSNLSGRLKVDQEKLMQRLKDYKEEMRTVEDLRAMWVEENEFGQILRILSNFYMRKNSLSYIFNSQVQNKVKHLKYKNKIIKGMQHPHQFYSFK